MKTIAGGSVANTIRGLSAGFGVSCGIIGAAQCVCLVDVLGPNQMLLSRRSIPTFEPKTLHLSGAWKPVVV
ncbi:hypothetical protein COP2_029331 [Malus domestica]